jgi:hypothetical protein
LSCDQGSIAKRTSNLLLFLISLFFQIKPKDINFGDILYIYFQSKETKNNIKFAIIFDIFFSKLCDNCQATETSALPEK